MKYLKFFSFFLIGIAIAQNNIPTPAEENQFNRLSSYSEMMTYLQTLDKQSDMFLIKIFGRSVEGREMPALFFSLDNSFGSQRDDKPVVLIFCQQHGDEPSGKEAALILARELSGSKKDILKHLDLILIPQMNPDGSEKGMRRNAKDMDLNRNHAILSEPEVQALHQLFYEWMPEVTLDVHEYNAISSTWIKHGFIKNADEQLGGLTNVNIDSAIIGFSRQIFIPEVGAKIKDAGYTFHRYIVGAPFEGQRIRYSTTAVNDGRQSLGIYNTLSFILEGKRYGSVDNLIERRTRGQLAALNAFLQTVAENKKSILSLVRESRDEIVNPPAASEWVHIQMDHYPDSTQPVLKFPVFNLHTWEPEERELKNYHPVVKPSKSILKPAGYIFSGEQTRLIELLGRHGIQIFRLKTPQELEVESYSILHVTHRREEELQVVNVDAWTRKHRQQFPEGSIVVWLNQKAGKLVPLLLEPQSTFGIVTENSGRNYRFREFLQEGAEYPVHRIMQKTELNTEMMTPGISRRDEE